MRGHGGRAASSASGVLRRQLVSGESEKDKAQRRGPQGRTLSG
jgi:hypothetical protein